jgi:hypothetical protein
MGVILKRTRRRARCRSRPGSARRGPIGVVVRVQLQHVVLIRFGGRLRVETRTFAALAGSGFGAGRRSSRAIPGIRRGDDGRSGRARHQALAESASLLPCSA